MPTFTLRTVSQAPTFGNRPLRGRTILIVEDEPLVALDVHRVLRAAGAGLIAATSSGEALALIRRNEIAAGIVDVNLAGEDCIAVCQALLHRLVPFAFYTGHAEASILKTWPEVPVLRKPARDTEIIACIIELTS